MARLSPGRLASVEESAESSESEHECEPTKIFARKLSIQKNVKLSSTITTIKEGYLMKQTWSFQRWKRRYFKLKGNVLYYAKDHKSDISDEIELSNLCYAECSIKNVNHSFQLITPHRSLVLCAENRREMEDWLQALKAASAREFFEPGPLDQHDFLSGQHNWYATSHGRPTYCNVCREALSGVTSHGLSCEICKCKVHKRCAAKAIANCKWTTLASVGKDIIEDEDGNIVMPHQWMEGNLPVSAKCIVCDKTCGSVLRLQDWRCLWCRSTVHTQCRPNAHVRCPLGPARVSVVPPTSLHSIGLDDAWDVVRPQGTFSPLLVFVNSKSGDNQGVKFLRRFKQLLNPAQVFDLISTGPGLGLRLFRHFDPFRILICSGDGSVGWVLSEIDRLDMQKQCQVAVLPLGTGNDLARVLGWGSSCDDDTNLATLLERYEKSSLKFLDRWSLMVFEKTMGLRTPKMSISQPGPDPMLLQYQTSAMCHLQSIIETDDFDVMITSVRILCEAVNDFIARVMENNREDEQLSIKCDLLRQKLGMLLNTLRDEENGLHREDELLKTLKEIAEKGATQRPFDNFPNMEQRRASVNKLEKDHFNTKERISRSMKRTEREALQCRANSLKRAMNNCIEWQDRPNIKPTRRFSLRVDHIPKVQPQTSSADTSPCSSPIPIPPITVMSPSSSTTRLTCISPLPDIRRDSVDEQFLNTLNLPAPKEFADPNSRRCSAAQPALIEENEESSGSGKTIKTALDSSSLKVTFLSDSVATTAPTSVTLENDTKPILFDFDLEKAQAYSVVDECNKKLGIPNTIEGDYVGFTPIEVLERNLLRQQQMNTSVSNSNNSLQVPSINIMEGLERLSDDNVYVGDNITIIDTDAMPGQQQKQVQETQPQQHSSSDEQLPGEASDLLSTISNEECSVKSEILDRPSESSQINVTDIMQDLDLDQIGHIDSPDASDNTDMLHGESLLDDVSSLLGQDILGALQDSTMTEDSTLCTLERERSRRRSLKQHLKQQQQNGAGPQQGDEPQQYGFENRLFDLTENRTGEAKRYPSLAQFDIENDIARKSFKRQKSLKSASFKRRQDALKLEQENNKLMDAIQIRIEGSHSDLSEPEQETIKESKIKPPNLKLDESNLTDEGAAGGYDEIKYSKETSEKDEIKKKRVPHISFVIEPPSPSMSDHELRSAKLNEIRRHSSHTPSLLAPKDVEMNRRHSGNNPNLLGLDREHVKFLSCSPAATRRISVGSLFKPNEAMPLSLGSSKSNMYGGSTMFGEKEKNSDEKKKEKERERERMMNKRLPIINPLVQLPSWPNVNSGFISKCLLANADTLCAAVSPLMDPDETLNEGYYEKCVMNNYFGIGIDAKISLDFHNKREEHPEKCRSRARNYMWYGVLGSKQWLQRTYKNLEQRVQLECDGQRIPLPSLQGIVILNIPSFMGGTNFWGTKKEDDIFYAPSFDDRILEVVAVFGSVQMAASRLINLQHHRIAQCQSIQINILGDEYMPIQVDGEAWLQPPGMIRIIHKNRAQLLCRNRSLEMSLKSWEHKQEKRRQSISMTREQTSSVCESERRDGPTPDGLFTERESYLLINFIECCSTLVKWVKLLIISHPQLHAGLYAVAMKTGDALEAIHPGGKIIEGPNLRKQLTELVKTARQLYEETCELLREAGPTLIMREDLESKLSVGLANMEMELRRCTVHKSENGDIRAYLNVLAPNDDTVDTRKKSRPFWMRFAGERKQSISTNKIHSSRDACNTWGVNEVITWLEAMQLSEYIDSFVRNDIRGKELLLLTRRDLKDLGVTKIGHIKRILQAIKDLSEN